MSEWLAYTGSGVSDEVASARRLPAPPPWRRFRGVPPDDEHLRTPASPEGSRAETFTPLGSETEMVNAALYLRRPLLVTGKPGTGKSSLAYSVARELDLGAVLQWPITSRSSLKDGLYRYDAVARLQDASQQQQGGTRASGEVDPSDVGKYIRLGALGTALLPRRRPRVLLIDELDKSDIDLPNDLLNIFEEGRFEIPELQRRSGQTVNAMTADPLIEATLTGGVVRCAEFPLVIITSNGEREFPPAFLRRCLRLQMQEPSATQLAEIVEAHLESDDDSDGDADWRWLIDRFVDLRRTGTLATDQLLNAVYLIQNGLKPDVGSRDELVELLLPHLDVTPRS